MFINRGNKYMKNTALITGASSGIGRELARIHAERGGDLVIAARSRDRLEKLKSELETSFGVEVIVIVKDLTRPEAPEEIFTELRNSGTEIDYLINNAGFGGLGKFHEREWEKDSAMISLNITALTALTRLFLPGFVKRKSGKILNISSTASLMPGPLQAVYYATKAYVTSFSNALAEELNGTGVTVTALLPGATDTGFGSISGMDRTSLFAEPASPRRVAGDGYRGMLEGKLNVVSGVRFSQKVMISLIPFLPKKIILRQIHRMQKPIP